MFCLRSHKTLYDFYWLVMVYLFNFQTKEVVKHIKFTLCRNKNSKERRFNVPTAKCIDFRPKTGQYLSKPIFAVMLSGCRM